MAKHEKTEYSCDRCSKKLHTFMNNMEIVTDLDPESMYWSRLHVKIEHHHGMHNDGTTEDADLCQACAIFLLQDALKRVRGGERLTAGVEHSDESGWEK